ncbi:hypothetical protein ASF21_00680 [Arthrobacter sp. Leaf234]|uniref:hypothetical protein n=1 Tax=Arthrobacter sp. Leaf234 TaxID=1736303 RepID=UPI0006FB86BE|nr:hypothetical protein [Arthrobacter sp. Leaf234]KQO02910.1 hypothetical protein ASF21_00680 [Arthrobacter sp. Leaf234]
MTGHDTPSPDPVLPLLQESGIPEDPALVRAVGIVRDLAAGPAPDASAALAQLMADGGKAGQGRRHKRRITFIGGALAVSMGVGMSGVAAGTVHFPQGIGDAVESITRFSIRDSADRAELGPAPLVQAGAGRAPSGPAGGAPLTLPAAPPPAPAAAPAPGGPAAGPGAGDALPGGAPAPRDRAPGASPGGAGAPTSVPASVSGAAPAAASVPAVRSVVAPSSPMPTAAAPTATSPGSPTTAGANRVPATRAPVPAPAPGTTTAPGRPPGAHGPRQERPAPGPGKATPGVPAGPRDTNAGTKAVREQARRIGDPGLRGSTHAVHPDGAPTSPHAAPTPGPQHRFLLMAPVEPWDAPVLSAPLWEEDPWLYTFVADPGIDDGTWWSLPADAPVPVDPAAAPEEAPVRDGTLHHGPVDAPVPGVTAVPDAQVDASAGVAPAGNTGGAVSVDGAAPGPVDPAAPDDGSADAAITAPEAETSGSGSVSTSDGGTLTGPAMAPSSDGPVPVPAGTGVTTPGVPGVVSAADDADADDADAGDDDADDGAPAHAGDTPTEDSAAAPAG